MRSQWQNISAGIEATQDSTEETVLSEGRLREDGSECVLQNKNM